MQATALLLLRSRIWRRLDTAETGSGILALERATARCRERRWRHRIIVRRCRALSCSRTLLMAAKARRRRSWATATARPSLGAYRAVVLVEHLVDVVAVVVAGGESAEEDWRNLFWPIRPYRFICYFHHHFQ